jgi:hypothetical protein
MDKVRVRVADLATRNDHRWTRASVDDCFDDPPTMSGSDCLGDAGRRGIPTPCDRLSRAA